MKWDASPRDTAEHPPHAKQEISGEPTFWLAIVSLSPLVLELVKFKTYSAPFYSFSSYSSFQLLFSGAWPLKWSQAQRCWSPYGPATERLVLWKKVFNCSWHFRARHRGNHLADSRCGLWCWQQTPTPLRPCGTSPSACHTRPPAQNKAASPAVLADSWRLRERKAYPSPFNTLTNYCNQTKNTPDEVKDRTILGILPFSEHLLHNWNF